MSRGFRILLQIEKFFFKLCAFWKDRFGDLVMKIYFHRAETAGRFEDFLTEKKIPAHEKIGMLFSQAIALLKEPETVQAQEFPKIFGYMGLDKRDLNAHQKMKHLFSQFENSDVVIEPTVNTGVFLIGKKEEGGPELKKVAVFKIGRKRAAMEILMRKFAFLLNLEKHMVPSMFCAIENPQIEYGENTEDTVEELWNGKVKRYVSTINDTDSSYSSEEISDEDAEDFKEFFYLCDQMLQKKPPSDSPKLQSKNELNAASIVVGIVQPFIYPQQEKGKDDLLEFTLMNIFAYAIGLRDGKIDGYIDNIWFDVEDCMAVRIDPPWDKKEVQMTASAFDLPYLDKDKRADIKLTHDQMQVTAGLVKEWNIEELIRNLNDQKAVFYDVPAEKMKQRERAFDEGGCLVTIDKPVAHVINGHLKIGLADNDRILTRMQLNACRKRLERLREFILTSYSHKRCFSSKDLLFAVDKHLHAYYKSVTSPSVPRNIFSHFDRHGLFSQMGRISPYKVGITIPKRKMTEAWPEKTVNEGEIHLYGSPPQEITA